MAFRFTEEQKQVLSTKRKEYLKNNPDKHPWKRKNKHKSMPCNKVMEYLDKHNIKYVTEWQPLEDRFFSIDIAFPDIKLGVEINGNQHYERDGSLKPYYQERHNLIENAGWKLLEIHYSTAYNLEKFEHILNIKEQPDYSEYFRIKQERDKNKEPNIPLPFGQKNALNSKKKWAPYIEILMNSGIDFSVRGWVKEVSKVLNISTQQSSKWMKRNMPEFYEANCKKRIVSHRPKKPAPVSQPSSKRSLNE